MAVEIEFDNALNEAGWDLLDKIGNFQHVEPHLFNNLKGCLKSAIETYLTALEKEKHQ